MARGRKGEPEEEASGKHRKEGGRQSIRRPQGQRKGTAQENIRFRRIFSGSDKDIEQSVRNWIRDGSGLTGPKRRDGW